MLNFVICEDEPLLLNKYINERDKFMMQYDMDYKCHKYNGYDDHWKCYAKKDDGFKVYLLDIKTKTGSGLDAARMIREEYDDWVSMIIIITAYSEYKYEALEKRLMLVDFINKLSNFETRLRSALTVCIKNYDNRCKSLRYVYKNNVYNIELNQILYIEKEKDNKRCIITTLTDKVLIPGTLNTIMKELDERFMKSSRSMIINLEQVASYYTKEGKIIYKNGETVTSISRNQKKEIMKYVRGIR